MAELGRKLQGIPVREANSPLAGEKEDRTLKIKVLSAYYEAIDARRDPQFNPHDVNQYGTLNVVPPVKSGAPAGADPRAIRDPKLRREYEAAIAKNRAKMDRYRFQSQLLALRKLTVFQLFALMQSERGGEGSREQALTEIMPDEIVRNRLLADMRELEKKHRPGGRPPDTQK
jgi:hypothetical protein